MFQNNLNQRSLRSILLLGAASTAAMGMATPASAQATGNVETVVVTGSRIPQQGLYSSSPVTAVGQQEMKFEGTTDVTTLINNLPEAFADQTNTMSNGATGAANLDLRGLGSKRTLVLVNGTRLMPGDPLIPVADVNQIPAALVDHVEVLTGGASAVYGSDALAGVVNFIMRKDFEGVEVDGTYSVNEADNTNADMRNRIATAGFAQAPEGVWDGSTADATLILGSNTANDKGNITAYLGYRDVQPVLEAARDFSACSLTTDSIVSRGESPTGGLVCSGSSNYDRFFSLNAVYGGQPTYDFFETGTGKTGSGTFVPYTGANNQHFNYGALNYLQRPDVRYTGGFFAHYQLDKELDIYSSFMFADDHTIAQIAPSGLFLGSGTISGFGQEINCGNPLMTAQENKLVCGSLPGDSQVTVIGPNGPFTYWGGQANANCLGGCAAGQALFEIGRRDIEGGNRLNDLRHTAYRMQIGARGDLGNGWSYDVYGQYGVTLFNETFDNEFSKARVQNALEVDPATGKCFAAEPNSLGIVTDAKCVPLDIFNGLGAITPQMLKYVKAQGFQEGYTTEQIVSGALTGDLGEWGGQSPWAKSPIGVSVGAEYRSEGLQFQDDQEFQTFDLYGQGGPIAPVPLAGFNVTEGFTEVKVPLIQDMPWVEDLTLNGGYRYSSYNIAGSVSAYKYGAEWQPIDDVRIRTSAERAVRAPNVLELFAPNAVALFGGNDPCATSTSGQCASVPNAGTPILDCPASQCNEQLGGNLHLRPEVSDTRTIGAVFTPTFLDGFTATVDYFAIHVSGFINSVSPLVTLAGCYSPTSTSAQQAFFCPLVHRNGIGQIFGGGFVSAQTTNTGFLDTHGVDIETNYTANMDDWGITGLGSLDFNLIGTYLQNLTTEPLPGQPVGHQTYDCAGLYGVVCGSPSPRWRHKFRITWTSPWDFDLSVDWRHFSSLNLDANGSNPLLNSVCGGPCQDIADNHIADFDYFDFAADWTVREGVDLHAGVNNVFDKNPPVLDSNTLAITGPGNFGNGNTFPGTYDSLGRTLFVGATIKY